MHLQRLIGRTGNDQVVGKILLHRRELGIDAAAEGIDLLAVLHLHRHGCGTAAPPLALFVGPGKVVQVLRRALVATGNVHQVAQINRALRGRFRRADDHAAYLLRAGELSRRINLDTLRADLELAAGKRDVART